MTGRVSERIFQLANDLIATDPVNISKGSIVAKGVEQYLTNPVYPPKQSVGGQPTPDLETRELKKQLADLTEVNSDLINKNSVLETSNQHLATRNTELKTRNQELETELQEYSTHITDNSELATRNTQLATENQQLKTDLETINQQPATTTKLKENQFIIDVAPTVMPFLKEFSAMETNRLGKPISIQIILIELFWAQVKKGAGDHLPRTFSDAEINRIIKNVKANQEHE